MKKLLAIMLAVVLAVTLAACAGAPAASVAPSAAPSATESAAPTPAPEPVAISVCVGPEPGSIDPTLNDAVDGAIYIQHFFEGLMRYNAETGKIENGIAKEIKNDGLVYTATLRDDAVWSDGQPVKAQDFVFSWNRAADPLTAAYYGDALASVFKNGVEHKKALADGAAEVPEMAVKAIDDKTLQFELAQPCGFLDTLLAFPTFMPLREDVVKGNDKWTQDPKTYLTNGRYAMASWEHDSLIVAQRFDKYYDQAGTKVDTINFKLFSDDVAELAAFNAGDLDFIDTYPAAEYDTVSKMPEYSVEPWLGTYYYSFNCTKKPLDNKDVRAALTLTIDRDYIVKQITKAGQVPAYAWVSKGVSDATPGSDFREVGGNYFESDLTKATEQAKQLLTTAGYPNGKGLPVIELTYNSNSTAHKTIAEKIANDWKEKLGIRIQLKGMEWAAFQEYRSKHEHTIARHAWIGDWDDPTNYLNQLRTGDGLNDEAYSNPAYDQLLKDAETQPDAAARMAKLHEAEKLLMADFPIAPIYFYVNENLAKTTLKGVKGFVTGVTLFWGCTIEK